jgi:hypothetical protein
MTAFWDIAPCSLVEVDVSEVHTALISIPSLRLHGVISQKAVIFILTAVRS